VKRGSPISKGFTLAIVLTGVVLLILFISFRATNDEAQAIVDAFLGMQNSIPTTRSVVTREMREAMIIRSAPFNNTNVGYQAPRIARDSVNFGAFGCPINNPLSETERVEWLWLYFTGVEGLSPVQTAGILGNMLQESRFQPWMLERGRIGPWNAGGAVVGLWDWPRQPRAAREEMLDTVIDNWYQETIPNFWTVSSVDRQNGWARAWGLIQWTATRREGLRDYLDSRGSTEPWCLEGQLEYLMMELRGQTPAGRSHGQHFLRLTDREDLTIDQAVFIFHDWVEISADSVNAIRTNRVAPAVEIYNRFMPNPYQPPADLPVASRVTERRELWENLWNNRPRGG
jgi:hypothetical protein